jgi:hypothetical protein
LDRVSAPKPVEPNDPLLDALSELHARMLLETVPLSDQAADVLNRHAWELYG